MTSPRPWKVVYAEYNEEEEVDGIVDANGNRVIETDSGFYPPKKDDAEMIVDAVNGIPHCEHCQAVAADASGEINRLRTRVGQLEMYLGTTRTT